MTKKVVDKGCILGEIDGRTLYYFTPEFVFQMRATHGMHPEDVGIWMNRHDVITDWQEVVRLFIEHENLSKKNSKFPKEIF